jgi:hypothetical protein
MERTPSHRDPTGPSGLPTSAARPGRSDDADEVIGLGYLPDELLPEPAPLPLWPHDHPGHGAAGPLW